MRQGQEAEPERALHERVSGVGRLERSIRVAVIGLRGVPHVIGGVESHCERLYPRLSQAHRDLDFWLLVRSRFTPPEIQSIGLAKVRRLWAPKSNAWEAAVHTIIAIVYARFKLKADLVHLHGIGPGFFSPLVKGLGMRLVVTHHAADFVRPKWGPFARRFLAAGEAVSARFADQVICVSEALRHEFLGRHPGARSRTVTITHGLAIEKTARVEGAKVYESLGLKRGGYVIAVGRLDETKRFHDLVSAMRLAGDDATPLVIVGSSVDGVAYADRLQKQAGPKVIFAGYRYGEELAALYRGAALLIHPSEMEGFGLVILEALTAETSVFVSDIPCHREFDLPEESYFPAGDIESMVRALKSPGAIVRPTEALKKVRKRYDPEVAIQAHAQIFARLAAKRIQALHN